MADPSALAEARWERRWYREGGEGFALRLLLTPLSWAFGAAVWLRGWLFDHGVLRAERVSARVISVGNLNVGGSGKTPVVIHLAQALAGAGKRVAVLSRGYRRQGGSDLAVRGRGVSAAEAGDEPALIAARVPGAVVLVGADRRALARRAITEHGCQTLILDDGFQHRWLHRDADILVLGGARPLGNRHLLPLGPLREGPSASRRATLTWLIDPGSEALPEELPQARIVSRTRVVEVVDAATGSSLGASSLGGKRAWMLAGLARPAGFEATLKGLGAELVGQTLFADHHPYTPSDLAQVQASARAAGAEVIATTEKDSVRIPEGSKSGPVPVAVVIIDLEVVSGQEHLGALLC